MNDVESNDLCLFAQIVQNLIGNHKADSYIELVEIWFPTLLFSVGT